MRIILRYVLSFERQLRVGCLPIIDRSKSFYVDTISSKYIISYTLPHCMKYLYNFIAGSTFIERYLFFRTLYN